MTIKVGDKAARSFVVDERAMRWFQEVSQDKSLIHCDNAYARSRGFEGIIAYGGIMLAHLSNLLGTAIPGAEGTSLAWSIKFHKPLYLGEIAKIEIQVVNVSTAAGVVESKFRIMAAEKKVASGTTQSIVPPEHIEH